jgi:hypothetical protein
MPSSDPRWSEEAEWEVRMTGVSGPQARRILTVLADIGVLAEPGKLLARCEHGYTWPSMPYSHYSMYHKTDHP